jgi:hypothetical protein
MYSNAKVDQGLIKAEVKTVKNVESTVKMCFKDKIGDIKFENN